MEKSCLYSDELHYIAEESVEESINIEQEKVNIGTRQILNIRDSDGLVYQNNLNSNKSLRNYFN